jgi:hypothetical protein
MLVIVGSQDRRPGLLFTPGAHLNSRLRLYREMELSSCQVPYFGRVVLTAVAVSSHLNSELGEKLIK